MASYLQTNRPMEVFTPLGPDNLLLVSLEGRESVSQLFRFELGLLAVNGQAVPFDKVLGQPVAVRLRLYSGEYRYICGYCSRFSQGVRDVEFTQYRMEVVPGFWFLTRRAQSRIFQQKSVPQILKEVLEGIDVAYELKGEFFPRDYCVQYRETDFHFASRLMEEEGIFYFFRHTEKGHTLVVSNDPQSHTPITEPFLYEEVEGGNRPEDRVTSWEKTQELRPGKVTLWDHTFEIPHDHLKAEAVLPASVHAGTVEHSLRVGRNDRLEVYDYPGEYAQRFDGIDPMGGDRPADIAHVTQDNQRTANLRMEEQLNPALVIEGGSDRADLCAGFRFRLNRHFDADGEYIVTEVRHFARIEGPYRSESTASENTYGNTFTCVPAEIPVRPARLTPKPVVQGPQTAVVSGPSGEKIFTDKYGRVKVQFHWDRQGANDAKSSCWVRVAQFAAGGGWGSIHIPRVGQEVVVAFEEGDPDRPLITGCVYNPGQMPPFGLPGKRMLSGFRSNTYPGPDGGGNNEISVDDTAGKERMYIHGQYNQDTVIEHDRTAKVHNNSDEVVDKNVTEKVGVNKTVTVGSNHRETVGANQTIQIGANQSATIGANKTEAVAIARADTVGAAYALTVGAAMTQTVGAMYVLSVGSSFAETVGQTKSVNVGKVMTVIAGDEITLQTGASTLTMKKDGSIMLSGKDILIKASGKINGKADGDMVLKGSKISAN